MTKFKSYRHLLYRTYDGQLCPAFFNYNRSRGVYILFTEMDTTSLFTDYGLYAEVINRPGQYDFYSTLEIRISNVTVELNLSRFLLEWS